MQAHLGCPMESEGVTELDQAIRESAEAVVALLHDRPEVQRREWSKAPLSLFKDYRASFSKQVNGVSRELLNKTLTLAILGTASLTELKKFKVIGHYDKELAVELLRNRQPDWLENWAEWFLQEVPLRWTFVRRLEREGLITRPPDPIYLFGLLSAANRQGALALLESDEELIREIPRLFEVEGGGEHSLAAVDKYNSDERSWARAMRVLSERGELSRHELLSWSLQALKRDFATFRAGWFSRFHESLEPTPGERASLTQSYLALLHSRVEPTVSFALKALLKIAKASELPQDSLSRGLQAVWLSTKKSSAKSGLRLLKKIGDEEIRLEHLSQAVLHPHVDIVQSALAQMKKLAPHPAEPWLSRWVALTEDLPASVRLEWSDWLGCEASQGTEFQVALPEAWTPGVLRPCAQVEEVCQLASGLLESMEPAWDIERLLDGILRFPKPESSLLPALKKRAKQRCKSFHYTSPLAAVLLTWMGQATEVEPSEESSLQGFLLGRLAEVQTLLLQDKATILYSLPHTEAGFVDVGRALQQVDALAERPYDLAQVMLRLPNCQIPVGKTEVHRLLAYAQGQTDKGRGKSFWPFAKKNPLDLCWSFADQLRAAGKPLPWSWQVERRESQYDGKTYVHHKLHLKTPEDAGLDWRAEPSSDAAMRRWESTIFPRAQERWLLRGLDAIANNLDWWEADWADIVYLEHLSRIQGDWCELEALLGAFGLACKEKGQFGFSVDVVGQGLASGQLTPEVFGKALSRVADTGMIKMNRWAKAFSELAHFAPQVRICESLEYLLAAAPAADLGKLFPPFLELSLAAGFCLQKPTARKTLESVKGKGAAAKAAKRLLDR